MHLKVFLLYWELSSITFGKSTQTSSSVTCSLIVGESESLKCGESRSGSDIHLFKGEWLLGGFSETPTLFKTVKMYLDFAHSGLLPVPVISVLNSAVVSFSCCSDPCVLCFSLL